MAKKYLYTGETNVFADNGDVFVYSTKDMFSNGKIFIYEYFITADNNKFKFSLLKRYKLKKDTYQYLEGQIFDVEQRLDGMISITLQGTKEVSGGIQLYAYFNPECLDNTEWFEEITS